MASCSAWAFSAISPTLPCAFSAFSFSSSAFSSAAFSSGSARSADSLERICLPISLRRSMRAFSLLTVSTVVICWYSSCRGRGFCRRGSGSGGLNGHRGGVLTHGGHQDGARDTRPVYGPWGAPPQGEGRLYGLARPRAGATRRVLADDPDAGARVA